jgi:hypothetical protein
VRAEQARAERGAHFGLHSRPKRCASAICSGVILAAICSRLRIAMLRSWASFEKVAKLNHTYDWT